MQNKKKIEYIDIWKFKSARFPFQIFIGGRGTGKTFSAMTGALGAGRPCELEPGQRFIWMRTKDVQVEKMISSDTFKKINKVTGTLHTTGKVDSTTYGFYRGVQDPDGRILPEGDLLGYLFSLSSVANVRSIDFSDCSDWFWDEFIKEKNDRRTIKDEAVAMLNAYETFNRNRELEGDPPLRLWMLANSNEIYNDIFKYLHIVNDVEKMIRKGRADLYLPDRALAIHLLETPESFLEAKKQTAIAKLTAGTEFFDMAYENKFAFNDFSLIAYRNLKGYRPICHISGGTYIYMSGGKDEIYVCYAAARCEGFDTRTPQERRRFMQEIGASMIPYFTAGRLIFESYELKALLLEILL